MARPSEAPTCRTPEPGPASWPVAWCSAPVRAGVADGVEDAVQQQSRHDSADEGGAGGQARGGDGASAAVKNRRGIIGSGTRDSHTAAGRGRPAAAPATSAKAHGSSAAWSRPCTTSLMRMNRIAVRTASAVRRRGSAPMAPVPPRASLPELFRKQSCVGAVAAVSVRVCGPAAPRRRGHRGAVAPAGWRRCPSQRYDGASVPDVTRRAGLIGGRPWPGRGRHPFPRPGQGGDGASAARPVTRVRAHTADRGHPSGTACAGPVRTARPPRRRDALRNPSGSGGPSAEQSER